MSLSVNPNSPFAYLQSLWQQQTSSASGTQAKSDPLSALLGSIGEQATPPAGSAATSSASTAASTTSVASPQFGSQTLQALLALQDNSSGAQSLATQFGDATTGDDPLSALQSQPSQGGHHHRHHHMAADGTNAQTGSAASDTSNSSNQSGNGTGNNILSQLLQMQAQLAPPAVAQNVTTA